MSDTFALASSFCPPLPLTAAQPGIWMAEQLAEQATLFTIAHYVEFTGPLNQAHFDLAIRRGLAEVDTVHARFSENDDGIPTQQWPLVVTAEQVNAPEWIDLSASPDGPADAMARMHEDLQTPLPASGDRPLYRQMVFQVSPGRWFWYQRFHHLQLDGFSFTALTARIAAHYTALEQQMSPGPSPFTPFSQVVEANRAWQASPAARNAAAFWQQLGETLPGPISCALPEEAREADGGLPVHYSLTLPADGLIRLAREAGVQPAEIAMAALATYFSRISGEERISLGFPFMRRMRADALGAGGPVVNVLPLVATVDKYATLGELARDMAKTLRQMRRHQGYEAEQICRDLGRSGSDEALYGPVINYKVYQDDLIIGGQKAQTHTLAMGPVDDLEVELGMHGEVLHLTLVANPSRYRPATLARHGSRLQHLLKAVCENPDTPSGRISLLTDEEQQQIDAWSCGATLPAPVDDISVVDWLTRRAQSDPDKVAVISGDRSLTWAQLHQRSMQLARMLISRGAGADDVVALGLPRTEQMVVAIFAVLASGAAYLPLDLDYPRERLGLMCDDARPVVILADDSTLAQMPEGYPVVQLNARDVVAACHAFPGAPVTDAERREPLRGGHLAYMIYTSGSTGRPKGVMSTHQGLLNLLRSHADNLFGPAIARFQTTQRRPVRAGHTASFSFDSSWEPLFCLLMGCELVVFDEELRRDAWGLVQQMRHTPVDIMDVTPSFLSQMIDSGLLEDGQPAPRFLMIGGEAATPRLWDTLRAHPHIAFHNYYGPSEYTIDTLGAAVTCATAPVIGRPVASTDVWLLDGQLQPVPTGVPGELYISGPGIARGYLGRPDLTAARFVANPFRPGQVMYRTGDVMRWRTDGQLAFIGRVDHQIKVRGFRVELGEVESALAAINGVSNAVVTAEPAGATWRLIGYCAIPDNALCGRPDITEHLQRQLAETLPDYMVPAVLVVLASLPLNVNGKVDRQALAVPQPVARAVGRAAATPEERAVCLGVAEVLGVPDVCVDDDFFALGGDSISAMSLGTMLRRAGWQLRPKTVFSARTPARMAAALEPVDTRLSPVSGPQTGPVDNLPVLRWYQTQGAHAFVHGAWLTVPEDLTLTQLQRMMALLTRAHPALGAVWQEGSLITAQTSVPETACHCLPATDNVDQAAEQAFFAAIERLSPADGVLWQAMLLMDNAKACGLVLVVHHLVIDGVSWRILLEDLPVAARAVIDGQGSVPGEGTSLYGWSQWLAAHQTACLAELPFWQQMLSAPCASLGRRPLDSQQDTQAGRQHLRTLLSPGHSEALLSQLPAAWRTSTETILMAAVFMACEAIQPQGRLRLGLESHGRPADAQDTDLSRTLGWLTAEYPVTFTLDGADTPLPLAAVRAVKSVMMSVPAKGTGYGVLRYLAQDSTLMDLEKKHAPTLLFNYLGRFVQSGNTDWQLRTTDTVFQDTFAVWNSPATPASYGLEINIFVGQGERPQLAIHWGWCRGIYTRSDIDTLDRALRDALDNLMAFARDYPGQAADTLVCAETGVQGLHEGHLAALRHRYGPLGDVLPLLPLQHGLLFHAQTSQQTGSYNTLTRLTLQGALSEAQLRSALNTLVQRYPQLGVWFDTEQTDGAVQILPPQGSARLYWPLDCVHLAQAQDLDALEQAELDRPLFNGAGPLLHALWVQHPDSAQHTLFLNAHHLVVDGWSTPVLVQDLLALLNAVSPSVLPPVDNWADSVRQVAARDSGPSEAVWQTHLHQVTPTLLAGEQKASGPVSTCSYTFDTAQYAALTRYCREAGLTLNTLMQGIWGLVLSLHTGQTDVVFGSPVSGRMAPDGTLTQQVGLFSNTLPVRVTWDMTQGFEAQLHHLQQQQIQLLEHDDPGLATLQRLAGTGTLFDTLLVVENYPTPARSDDTPTMLHCTGASNRGYTHYPATLLVLPGETLTLHLEYRQVIEAPEALLSRVVFLLEQALHQPKKPLYQWPLCLAEENARLDEYNQTAVALAQETLPQAIAAQAARTPDAIALEDAAHRLSWREMQAQVASLASRLTAAGVVPGDIVAVALPRSVRLSLALQAIVALGAAWLPLDVSYPDERLHMMLDDAAPGVVITESDLMPRFAAHAVCLCYDRLAQQPKETLVVPDLSPMQAAYVLYTSGSTGRPKGVVVSHQAIINRLRWMQATWPLDGDDVVLQKTPCSFDVSVWEFFWPLMCGARLVMAPPEAHRDPQMLLQVMEDYQVTTLHFVPSMLATWLETLALPDNQGARCPALRRVFCSGEALSSALARRYEEQVAAPLHNLYGPTEAAVDVTWQPASGDALSRISGAGVPIGRAVWNTRLYILDAWLRPVPPGVPGELYLAGVQLAQGYLKRPDLTAGRFVADPFAPGERMYRTGDVARWLADGAVDYLGRVDFQLKIRGQRIEPGEIEQALLTLPEIRQAVVDARALTAGQSDADSRQLIAWLIARDPENPPDALALQQALSGRLPAHMVPVRYQFVPHFPLSANGKLDRKALPLPVQETAAQRLPSTKAERQVATCFTDILRIEQVGADDDFFALGGHSLLAMRLAVALRKAFDRPVSIGEVMASRTVSRIAALMTHAGTMTDADSRGAGHCLPLRAGEGPALFCFHPASGFAWQYSGLLQYLGGHYPIIGLQSPRPDGVIASAADINEACERHLAVLREQQPSGPYYLLGYSLGGTLAHGVAARLNVMGETVAFLGLLDTWPPEGQDWGRPDEDQAKEEVAHEQAAFMADTRLEQDPLLLAEKQAMFSTIVANYQDAVRLLAGAASVHYPGTATLFVATRTVPQGMDPHQAWAPWTGGLTLHPLDCEHADILAPQTLTTLGPLLNQVLENARR